MDYFKFLFFGIAFFLINPILAAENLSLREKIGQMLIIGFEGKQIDNNSPIIKAVNEDNIGGVILFDYNYRTQHFDKNIESPEQVRKLNHDLQEANRLANRLHHRPQLPLLISVDYEGGAVNRLKTEYGFPETYSAAQISKLGVDEAERLADRMGKTLEDAGFNLNFAPDLDVNVNPENPIIGKLDRSFSADPHEVASFSSIYSRNFLQHKTQCAFKHFPGHGSSNADSHRDFVDVTNSWQEYELDPYQLLLGAKDSCKMIMTAHIVNHRLDESGLPATLSHKILTGLLRQQLKFDGVIITDDMQMKAISDHYGLEQALTLAVNAGADMFIFGNQLSEKPQHPKELIDIIEAKVKKGEISPSRIDDAYQHIKAFKSSLRSSAQ
ncbi:glycoside hydrolase family 3 protein [Legionella micdadei]|uniref:Beta-N-acetylhexosaminidase n=1 Tax=Legionella micdadei TaxID=451 RepID=A0A098GA84_LEGMI|nr:glycoside hydrolase family 3 N-terminal domain-containing protein [Legionella micdadei]ARG96219.1 glycosyl hydrolase [Legionella micdadei]ARG98974.1 glycosyl hydrolase [Legionella micdadei]KTD29031.1 N-acetyl-beta-glucosaminidase [Legionella micdadei]NSL17242.1 glycoside hydrolase family 3 protein [Legionella micdadei]CEG59394.1 Glycosyl hydrolase [Legionella micdadei]